MHKLALLTILILGVVAGAPRIAAADKKPLDVASIAPAVAQRGALVTVEGHGFGGPNVRITVGGESVPVIAATGTTATFRVPPLGAVGRVTVRVTNPGGHAGEIGLNVLFDGSVSVQADTAAAVATEIGTDGGSLEAAGMTLAIPAGAVPEGVTITATPLRALAGSPFAGAPVGLQLEPSGLVLLQPATLTLPKPAGPRVVAFGFDGDGENLHLIPHADSGSSLSLQVWHFSGAGATTVSAAELQAVLGYEPTRAHQLAEQRIAAAIDRYADGGPAPAQAIFDALVAWRSSMNNGLEVAMETGRLDFFELAFGEWQAWRAYAQQFRNEMTPEHLSFIDVASRHDRDFATAVAAEIARPLLNRCIGPGIPRAALRDVLRLANAVNLDALPI